MRGDHNLGYITIVVNSVSSNVSSDLKRLSFEVVFPHYNSASALYRALTILSECPNPQVENPAPRNFPGVSGTLD